MPDDFMPIKNWDHIELWVGNAKQAAFYYEKAFGFAHTAYLGPETGVRDRASYVLGAGRHPPRRHERAPRGPRDRPARPPARRRRQGHRARGAGRHRGVPPGRAARRGRRRRAARGRGRVRERRAGHDRHLRRDRAHLRDTRRLPRAPSCPATFAVTANGAPTPGVGLLAIDHCVGNVELGRMDYWVSFYERAFGMTEMLHFDDNDISTEYSALMSKVMSNGNERVKFPINEPADGKRKTQIEEYLEFYRGPGVQHIAMATRTSSRRWRRCGGGVDFLRVPDAYYDDLRRPRRQDRRALRRPEASSASWWIATTKATCCRSSRVRLKTGPRCSTR